MNTSELTQILNQNFRNSIALYIYSYLFFFLLAPSYIAYSRVIFFYSKGKEENKGKEPYIFLIPKRELYHIYYC